MKYKDLKTKNHLPFVSMEMIYNNMEMLLQEQKKLNEKFKKYEVVLDRFLEAIDEEEN